MSRRRRRRPVGVSRPRRRAIPMARGRRPDDDEIVLRRSRTVRRSYEAGAVFPESRVRFAMARLPSNPSISRRRTYIRAQRNCRCAASSSACARAFSVCRASSFNGSSDFLIARRRGDENPFIQEGGSRSARPSNLHISGRSVGPRRRPRRRSTSTRQRRRAIPRESSSLFTTRR